MGTWLIDLLDRELPGLTGGKRDELARKIVEELPLIAIAAAICSSAYTQLRVRGHDETSIAIARDIANNAAMAVVAVLVPDVEDDDQEITVR